MSKKLAMLTVKLQGKKEDTKQLYGAMRITNSKEVAKNDRY